MRQREKIGTDVKQKAVTMITQGTDVLETAERLGLKGQTVATGWKRWRKELGMDIPDRERREAVRLIGDGCNPDQAAAQLGLDPEVVVRWWKQWRDDVHRELPEYLRPMMRDAGGENAVVSGAEDGEVEATTELDEAATEAETEALSCPFGASSPGVGGEKGAEDGEVEAATEPDEATTEAETEVTEATEPEKETEMGAGEMAEKKNGLDETIGLIRAVDELLTGYLSGGKTVQAASILVDDGNWFELMLTQTEEGRRQAQLSVRVTLEGEEDV